MSRSSTNPPDPPNAFAASRRGGFSLQQKAWLVSTGVLVLLAALLALGVDFVFSRSSRQLEQAWVADSVRRVQAAQMAVLENLERTARDYATWTDTYDFIGRADPAYVTNNLTPATFANLQLDAFLIFDREGALRVGRTFQGAEVSSRGLEEIVRVLTGPAVRVASGEGRAMKGLLELPQGIAAFAMLPVVRDDGTGPVRGALAQVRIFSPARVARMRDAVNLDLVLRVNGDALVGESSLDRPDAGGRASSVVAIDDATMLARVVLRDLDERAIGQWQITLNRQIHLQGVKTRVAFYLVMTVLTLVAALLIGWLLRKLVIARLEAVHAAVERVGTTGDLSVRLPLQGSDELTRVAAGINRMFEALARGEAERLAATAERERLGAQLQQAQRLEAIGTLTGGLAHDFNNLLTSIQGSMTLLRMESAPTPAGERHLRRMEAAAAHAERLVRQMMAFGRQSPVIMRQVHLAAVVRDALQLLRATFPRTIEFRFEEETSDDLINADAGQLQQVLVNLATNASQAMAGGVGRLTMRISAAQLPDPMRPETTTAEAGDYLRLEVSDTGCGIPPEELPRIFEPFFTTKPVGSGAGLGLAVVHGIVSAHRGTIGVRSEVNRGTTFFLHWPKIPDTATAILPPAVTVRTTPAAAAGKAGRLLLVDDDTLVRETLEAGTRRLGYEVTTAASGAQALKLVREQSRRFDLVVTDQMMPGMTGTELGEILRAEDPGLPLVLITGFAAALSEAKVKAGGFSAMLMKPVTIGELDRALQAARRPGGLSDGGPAG